jgi:uncharacterized hydrophobic protein (TIGR00271 family)
MPNFTYNRLKKDSELTLFYLALMSISGILAAVAFLTDSIPILIGSMVVAPLFPPLMLVSFAVVAGEYKICARGLYVTFIGLITAIAAAVLITQFLNTSGILPQDLNMLNKNLLEERVRLGWYSMIVAMAAGIAGTIATLKKKTDILIGTVASLALVPAGAAAGVAFVSGAADHAYGGLFLLFANLALIVSMSTLLLISIYGGRIVEKKDSLQKPTNKWRAKWLPILISLLLLLMTGYLYILARNMGFTDTVAGKPLPLQRPMVCKNLEELVNRQNQINYHYKLIHVSPVRVQKVVSDYIFMVGPSPKQTIPVVLFGEFTTRQVESATEINPHQEVELFGVIMPNDLSSYIDESLSLKEVRELQKESPIYILAYYALVLQPNR